VLAPVRDFWAKLVKPAAALPLSSRSSQGCAPSPLSAHAASKGGGLHMEAMASYGMARVCPGPSYIVLYQS